MKKVILCLLLGLFSTLSFAQKDIKFKKYTLKFEEKQKFEEQLLYNLKMATPKIFKQDVVITKSEIIQAEKQLHLRTYYNNGFVSTSLLKKNADILSLASTTSCTSKFCATGGGCQPQSSNRYCTPCKKDNDCIRTTTN